MRVGNVKSPAILITTLVASVGTVLGQNLSDATLALVQQRLAEKATHSWELGTRTQALLEFTAPEYSVFNQQSLPNLPPPASVDSSLTSSLNTIFNISRTVVNARANTTGFNNAQPLFDNDTSAGDPASMGVSVLLANWTNAGGADFAGAATQQLNYLLYVAPHSDEGAISHRTEQVQLWSDSVYMVPPFLAYYGVMTSNQSLLQAAYDQIRLYRDALRDGNKTTEGLWWHVVMGTTGVDYGHWSTGMGWAAAGMLRVYATISNSQFSNQMKNQKKDLSNWVNEIHGAIYPLVDSSGLFHNYADNTEEFLEASSTALMAATVYRSAVLTKSYHWVPDAELARKALFATNTTGMLTHFDANGWLNPVVNPFNTGAQGTKSPEGQAFVLELQSAYQDWLKVGSVGINEASRMFTGPSILTWVGLLIGLFISMP